MRNESASPECVIFLSNQVDTFWPMTHEVPEVYKILQFFFKVLVPTTETTDHADHSGPCGLSLNVFNALP